MFVLTHGKSELSDWAEPMLADEDRGLVFKHVVGIDRGVSSGWVLYWQDRRIPVETFRSKKVGTPPDTYRLTEITRVGTSPTLEGLYGYTKFDSQSPDERQQAELLVAEALATGGPSFAAYNAADGANRVLLHGREYRRSDFVEKS